MTRPIEFAMLGFAQVKFLGNFLQIRIVHYDVFLQVSVLESAYIMKGHVHVIGSWLRKINKLLK